MANEQRTKFLELRKQGVDPVKAREQAYGKMETPIANTPVAWQAPAITPLPTETQTPEKTTAQLNQEQLLRNQAKVQGEILAWTRPEVWITPENVIPPVETPNVAPTPTTTPVTTPTPTVTPTTPEVKAETKATTTPTPPVIPKTVDGIYNAIAGWQVLTDDVLRTPQYKQAKQRFDAVGKFGAMTVQQLSDSIKQGQITTSVSSALANNPNYQLARQKVDTENKNKMLNNVYSTFSTGKELVIENPVESISDKLISKYWLNTNESRNLYQEIVKNNTDVVNYAKQLSDVNKQIADTTKVINDGYKEIRKNYGGKLSASQLIAYMWSRFRDATELLSSLNTTKDYLKADLETASDLAMGEYNASIKDMERSDAIRNALFSAELWLYTEGQKLKLQADFAKQQAEQAMNDPLTAVTSLVDEYKKQGIPFTRSTQEMVREAQAYVAGGGNLADYLTQLQTTIQTKPEYQRLRELQQGQLTDREKMGIGFQQDIAKMQMEQDFQMKLAEAKKTTDNKWTKLDDGLYQDTNGNIITGDELKQAKLLWNNYITKWIGQEGGECGFYASRGTWMTATPGGNSKEARVKAFSDTTPQVWGMAFFEWAGYDPTYWHISIVTGINDDWTINVKDSNFAWDKKVQERTVPASSVTGYYNNTPLANSLTWQAQATGYSDADIELLADIASMEASAQNTALKNSWVSRQQLSKYKADAVSWKIPPTEWQKQSAFGILSNIQGIAQTDWNDAVWKYDYSRALGLQWAEDARTLIDNLRDAAAINNLWVLKWPMSDKDIAFIKSVSSKLDPVQSNAQFEKNIVEMYNIAARKVWVEEIKKLSDIPKERILPWQTNQSNTWAWQISPQDMEALNRIING